MYVGTEGASPRAEVTFERLKPRGIVMRVTEPAGEWYFPMREQDVRKMHAALLDLVFDIASEGSEFHETVGA